MDPFDPDIDYFEDELDDADFATLEQAIAEQEEEDDSQSEQENYGEDEEEEFEPEWEVRRIQVPLQWHEEELTEDTDLSQGEGLSEEAENSEEEEEFSQEEEGSDEESHAEEDDHASLFSDGSDDSLFVDQSDHHAEGEALPSLDELLPEFREELARTREVMAEPERARSRPAEQARWRREPETRPQQNNRTQSGGARHNVRVIDDELIEIEIDLRGNGDGRNRSGRSEPIVIDLTGEPDSPPARPNRPAQRARRWVGRAAPPENNNNNANPPVIDLTLSDDENDRQPPPPPRPLPRNPPPHNHNSDSNRQQNNNSHMLNLPHPRDFIDLANEAENDHAIQDPLYRTMSRMARTFDLIHRLGGVWGRQPQNVDIQLINPVAAAVGGMNNPLAGNPPVFNYAAAGNNSSNAGNNNKNNWVAPPKARAGFTRDTGDEEMFKEQMIVCPSCEEELKYDPDAKDSGGPPAAKRVRTRKDREEHYFWAIKECGHVGSLTFYMGLVGKD
ncbi:uncharacterized protein CTHT_0072550 [Thermochaetoides thermophila DSM 1495]|uniref:Uncharacterized protein n=1 Tax=Chaetomium thermophilum (strain DSM 1495 / CBS 144.50 / IMI 039719) TaxID=759272 RepID=G0SFY1_CHATD|nr:hypothetical protein CTHT_0072550 [Thermochaetoides thermophila DSM 1495]EGS17896.1 hypothetical protein CTHT_0072550 [Thermochaetoides thermophila DSM 1495]